MSDYFRFYCDGLDEPRLLYAMHQCPHVPLVWLWVLCECARTKRNQIEQPSNSMIVGLQHKLNVPPDSILICLRLLTEIEYLAFESGYYIVRKWNDLQSKYMQEKAWRETHKHQKKPKETKNPIGEERRGEEKKAQERADLDYSNFIEATKSLKASHDSFASVPDAAIENTLRLQPDKSKWKEAIETLVRHNAGVRLNSPCRVLERYLLGRAKNEQPGLVKQDQSKMLKISDLQ